MCREGLACLHIPANQSAEGESSQADRALACLTRGTVRGLRYMRESLITTRVPGHSLTPAQAVGRCFLRLTALLRRARPRRLAVKGSGQKFLDERQRPGKADKKLWTP